MTTFELTDDELNTLHDAFNDVGNDYPGVDWDKFKALGIKFGFWEAEKPPTAEELKIREGYNYSPFVNQMWEVVDKELLKIALFTNPTLLLDKKSQLKIKLPNDYNLKENK